MAMLDDPVLMFLSAVWSIVGAAVWLYGKRQKSFRHGMLGLALMIVPGFLTTTWGNLVVGTLLTILLFWP